MYFATVSTDITKVTNLVSLSHCYTKRSLHILTLRRFTTDGSLSADEAKEVETTFKAELDQNLDEAKKTDKAKITSFLEGNWKGVKMAGDKDFEESPDTSVNEKTFLELAKKTTELPKDKKFFNKIQKVFEDRKAMIANDNYDWAMGELLAYASLMQEGFPVRFSGQDVERGTFSHRR
jgi:2-oxoglutarate dehydrogenase E1 component